MRVNISTTTVGAAMSKIVRVRVTVNVTATAGDIVEVTL